MTPTRPTWAAPRRMNPVRPMVEVQAPATWATTATAIRDTNQKPAISVVTRPGSQSGGNLEGGSTGRRSALTVMASATSEYVKKSPGTMRGST